MANNKDDDKLAAYNQSVANRKEDGSFEGTRSGTNEPDPTIAKAASASQQWNKEERDYYKSYLFTQHALVLVAVGGLVITGFGILIALCTLRSLDESVRAPNQQASPLLVRRILLNESLYRLKDLGSTSKTSCQRTILRMTREARDIVSN
jgi:hypothetical protein